MSLLNEKFAKLDTTNAPGQEARQKNSRLDLRGEKLTGTPVDFSHGDVDAHPPIPGSLDAFIAGVRRGGSQAYTQYRGSEQICEDLARKLSGFTGTPISAENGLIITSGTQGALFLAMGSMIARGDKVAITMPDYFANRKLVEFFEGEIVPISMDYLNHTKEAGLDLAQLEDAFRSGVKLFQFSNPNNPTGVIYSPEEIRTIADLAKKYGASIIVDQLYSRQIFDGRAYTHLCAMDMNPDNLITIIGPSKTESLSGYRLGTAFGSTKIIARMEKLQAIVCLRAGGYNQAVMNTWFCEPEGWMESRITSHQAIRDDLLKVLRAVEGVSARTTEAGSYLFPRIPALCVHLQDFVRILRIQAGVCVTPGMEFGSSFTNSFRINFSQNHQAAVQAMIRTMKLMERYRV